MREKTARTLSASPDIQSVELALVTRGSQSARLGGDRRAVWAWRALHPFSRVDWVPASTARAYYDTLKDTFIAHEVPAVTETRKRKLVCMEPTRRVVEGIEVTPWEEFLDALWLGGGW